MENKTSFRTCSNASRIWVAAEQVCPPLANQMIMEGTGDINRQGLARAVEIASEANPGSRLKFHGYGGMSKWIDSRITPAIREVDESAWDGMSSENAPFLKSVFHLRKGATCEVVIINGAPPRIAFRTHHAVMDGRGTMLWAEDIFRVLRGEEPLGSQIPLTENDLLNLSGKKLSKTIPHRYISPAGRAAGNSPGLVWKRTRTQGPFTKLLPRIMLTIAREAWRHEEGMVRIGIPVDLRPRKPEARSTGNLTNALYIDISRESTLESVGEDLQKRLAQQIDGELTWEDRIVRHLPLWVLRAALREETRRKQAENHFRCSAFVSNLGRFPVENFYGGGFTARTVFFVPVCLESLPVSITTTGNGDTLEILTTMPGVYAGNGRMEAMLDAVTDGLRHEK